MSCLLYVTDEEAHQKINIDDLYEKKHQKDLKQLSVFNKILNRIHVRIKTTSRQKTDEQFCWFVVPEVIIGVPKYDQALCIAYLIDKLKVNQFNVRYIHPNTLFISWIHWVPSYVRGELKKKTGIIINEFGLRVDDADDNTNNQNKLLLEPVNPNDFMLNLKNQDHPNEKGKPLKKDYTPIASYKPSGNLVYGDDLLNKIDNKFS